MAENKKEKIKIEDIKTVSQMLDWKKSDPKDGVESKHKTITDKFEWSHTDVLYSFLGIYALGVYAYNKDNGLFSVTEYQIKDKKYDTNIYSLDYVSSIQSDSQYELDELNEVIEDFIALWSEVGNVFPIWPGGNMARGKANIGCFDIPERCFATEYEWFLALRRIYKDTIHFDGYIDIGTPKLSKYSTLKNFLKTIDTPDKYKEFLKRICKIIEDRTYDLKHEYILRIQLEQSMNS